MTVMVITLVVVMMIVRVLALELRKSGNGRWGGILVGVVVSDVGTPLLPRLRLRRGLAFELREAGDRRRVRVLVGVVVSYVGTPLLPSLGFRGRLALALSGVIAVLKVVVDCLNYRVHRPRFTLGVLPGSGVGVTDGLAPLPPSLLRFRFALRVLPGSGVVVTDGLTPLFPGFRLGRWLAFELGEPRDGRRGGILAGVVVSDVGTPLRPRLGFRRTLELRESRDIAWGSVLVGVVVPDVGTPFRPSYGGKRKSDRDGIEGRMVEGNSHSGWGARATGTAKALAEMAPTARVERATFENMMI